MANLIITIISIALVVLLAGATIFFGGQAFKANKIEAETARYLNESSQVKGALTAFKAQGNDVTSDFTMSDLVDGGYLKTIPLGWDKQVGVIGVNISTADDGSDEAMAQNICVSANESMGFSFDPSDSDVMAYIGDENNGIPYCEKDMEDAVPCCVIPSSEPEDS